MKVLICTTLLLMALTACKHSAEFLDDSDPVFKRLPNIVIVIADDQNGMDAGAYGNRDVKTPNIDLLADQGMRFDRAFTGTAMCAATRQQLYTGLYPVRSGAYPNHSLVKEGTRSIATYLKELGYRVALNGKRHFGPAESFPFEYLGREGSQKSPSLVFDDTEEFISRNGDQPYFLVIASRHPHFPWESGDQAAYDPDELTVPTQLVDTPETRQALANYYAEIGALDDEVGEVMDMVERSGTAENTVFIYTSEQGSMFMQGKWTLYDSGIKTGFIVRWPEKVEAGSKTDAMIHYVDVVPTLLDIAGMNVPDLDGESFLNVLRGKTDHHKDYIFGVHTTRGINYWRDDYPIRSVRTEQYKLILNLNHEGAFSNGVVATNWGDYYESWNESGDAEAREKYQAYQKRPPVELYDVEKDPNERINLAGRADYEEIQKDLTLKLTEWMDSQGDTGIEIEREAGKRMNHPVPPRNTQPLSFQVDAE